MKRLLLSACCALLTLFAVAQSNNSGAIVKYGMKSSDSYTDGYKNPVQIPFVETHAGVKGQLGPVRGGSRAVTTDQLGSAGNLFTILDPSVNRVTTNADLNTNIFIHRADPTVLLGTNVGQYTYDVSFSRGDAGTWDINRDEVILNPTGNNVTTAGRYPNATIYNPVGNTDPDSAYLVYFGPWLPFGSSATSWEGIVHGVIRLDNDTSTRTETFATTNNGDVGITGGLCKGTPGIFWAVDFAFDETENYGIIIYKGVWNDFTKDVDWSMQPIITPAFDRAVDGTSQAAAINMSFDPTGQFGWICFLGDVEAGGDQVLKPVFYRTVDGGNNWTGPIVVDLLDFDNVVNNLTNPGTDLATPGFDLDMVVDVNGNPHVLFVVGSNDGSGGSEYTIATGGGSLLNMYDLTYDPNRGPDCEWYAIHIDSASTFRGDLTADVSEDNRPQVSLSTDGAKVFFGWGDSDPTITGGTNIAPNLKTRAIDVNSGLATGVVNWTEGDPNFDGQALFISFAPTTLESGGAYSVPTVFGQINPISGLDQDPANFFYVNNVGYTNGDFTMDIEAPVVTLTGANPVTVVSGGGAYVDAGASGLDNVDGSVSVNIDASAVNTAVVGSYEVTFNVTDAAGNSSCQLTRTVNVVASADNTPPTITLNGPSTITADICDFFRDPGVVANDNVDGDITGNVVVDNQVTLGTPGNYIITYNVTDGAGNSATPDTLFVTLTDLAPTITLLGNAVDTSEICLPYNDAGAFGFDNCLGSVNVTTSGSVDNNTAGTYTLTYTATDGNSTTTETRTVVISPDVTPPVITITGNDPLLVYLGTNINDPGATADDCVDGAVVVTADSSNVQVATRGVYTITYTATDAAGNVATTTRTVIVNTEPDCAFTVIENGLQVAFTDASLYNPTSWSWDFGDFNNSTQPNPVYSYSIFDTYTVCLTATNDFGTCTQECQDITVTGIEELLLNAAFSLYPNPTEGIVNLQVDGMNFEEVTVEVFDLVGARIKNVNYASVSSGNRFTIDLSENVSGMYFVKISTDQGSITKKVNLMD